MIACATQSKSNFTKFTGCIASKHHYFSSVELSQFEIGSCISPPPGVVAVTREHCSYWNGNYCGDVGKHKQLQGKELYNIISNNLDEPEAGGMDEVDNVSVMLMPF